MMISGLEHRRLNSMMAELKTARYPFWTLWRDVADYFLPKRYVWLQSHNENRVRQAKNPYILDSTGTIAARILASGMMNGITSPSRPWFRLRVPGFDTEGDAVSIWADECVRRMLFIMSESNFYNAMAVLYLDLVVFGSAAVLIYEDEQDVIRCYNPALGEFYLGQDHRLSVDTFAREFQQSAKQLVSRFGEENVSPRVRDAWKKQDAQSLKLGSVNHLIEPNRDGNAAVPKKFAFRETYWEAGVSDRVLYQGGFNELPGIFPRWELTANDSYGTSPAMDALPDVIQLQQETKRKAQGLDKMINPPIVADIQLQHRPTALVPGGVTFIAGANNFGAKPLYQISPPLQEMTADIQQVQLRIRETLHNNLFNMISQLETVRSATEVDARREEKLVLLGSVLERFENEALDPAINRIFSIMSRQGMLPDPPEELEDVELEIQYVSILSTAQSAVSAAPTERWVGFIGNLAGVVPDALKVPNWDELIRNYGAAIGVQARDMRPREDVAAEREAEQEKQAMAEATEVAGAGAEGAKLLSETDVGGGANALQELLAVQ